MLTDDVKEKVKEQLNSLDKPVKFVLFTQEIECLYCKETKELISELAELSDKLSYEEHLFEKDDEAVKEYQIDKIPAVAVTGEKDYGIRFYGIPSGYEFSSLLEAIKLVSTGNIKLADETKTYLDSLTQNIKLQVFVTPTCPYCPTAVVKAHHMAYYSDKVTAHMVEATEFPHLAQKYQVQGVPRTVINERGFVEGAVPDPMLIEKIKETIM